MIEYSRYSSHDDSYNFKPIAIVHSPFKDKYGVPRQPSLVEGVRGVIEFKNDPDLITSLKSLEQFSHLWLIFVFHAHGGKNWKPSIRPPRLGGRTKVGVLASRSPHRPNPIGISVVKIESIKLNEIEVSGLDLIDGTPILDIKPYIAYADSISNTNSGWANDEIKKYELVISESIQKKINDMVQSHSKLATFESVLKNVLEIDPRPAYQQRSHPIEDPTSNGLNYGIEIMGVEVKYEIHDCKLWITNIFYKNNL